MSLLPPYFFYYYYLFCISSSFVVRSPVYIYRGIYTTHALTCSSSLSLAHFFFIHFFPFHRHTLFLFIFPLFGCRCGFGCLSLLLLPLPLCRCYPGLLLFWLLLLPLKIAIQFHERKYIYKSYGETTYMFIFSISLIAQHTHTHIYPT